MLQKDLQPKLDVRFNSPGYVLVHELWHYLAGIEYLITDGDVRINRSAGFYNGTDVQGREMVLEATAEALTRWTLSSESPDFSNMSVEEFFTGPNDFPMFVYMSDQKISGQLLRGIDLNVLLDAYFVDGIVRGVDVEPLPETRALDDAIRGCVELGWSGLSTARESINDKRAIPLPDFVASNPFLSRVAARINEFRCSRSLDGATGSNASVGTELGDAGSAIGQ